MKKILSILLLVCVFGMNAQVQTFNTQLKFNNVPLGQAVDSLLAINSTGLVKKVKKSDLLESTSTPAMLQGAGHPLINPSVAGWHASVIPREAFYYDNDAQKLYTFDFGSSDWTQVGGITVASTLQAVTTAGNTTNNNVVINNNSLRVANTVGGTDERVVIESDGITFVPDAVEYVGKLSLPDVTGESVAWSLPDLSGTLGLVEADFGDYGSYSFGGMYSSYPDLKRLYFSAAGNGVDGLTGRYALSVNPEEGANISGQNEDSTTFASVGVSQQNAVMSTQTADGSSTATLNYNAFELGFNAGSGSSRFNFIPSALGAFSSNFYYTMPENNGTLALVESTALQNVVEAGNTANFNSDNTAIRLPNDSDHSVNISSTNTVSGNNEYYTIFGAEGSVVQQVGEYNDALPSYGDRTFQMNDTNIQLRNYKYSLPADENFSSGEVKVFNNSVSLIASDYVASSTTSVNLEVDGIDLISTDASGSVDLNVNSGGFSVSTDVGGDTASLSFNSANGLGITTNASNYKGYISSDDLTSDYTYQLPNASGEIALQHSPLYSHFFSVTNPSGNITLVNETTGDLSVKTSNAAVNLATLGFSGLNLFKSSGTLAGNINVDDLTGSKTYNLPNANGKLVVVGTTAPASATATGAVGEIRVTSTYVYTCIATNTWVRAAVATW